MKIVSIDPSVNHVGWAVCDGLTRDEHGVWDDSASDWRWGKWDIRSNSLTYKLREIVEWMIIEFDGLTEGDLLVLEWPAYFGSQKGQVAAQQGHTINLAAVDAYIAGFFRLPPQDVYLLTATEWKGNIPKEITRRRFFRALGQKKIFKIDHNAVDAVMLLHTFAKRKRITFRLVSSTGIPDED
jgi:hypothetical protein